MKESFKKKSLIKFLYESARNIKQLSSCRSKQNNMKGIWKKRIYINENIINLKQSQVFKKRSNFDKNLNALQVKNLKQTISTKDIIK